MKLIAWLVGALFLAVCAMSVIFWYQTTLISQESVRIAELTERQSLVTDLTSGLDKYRRQSASFRRLTEDEIAEEKASIKQSFKKVTSRLDQLTPTSEDKATTQTLASQLADLFALSTKLEPMLYSRDIFQKEEARDAADEIDKTLKKMKIASRQHEAQVRDDFIGKRTLLIKAFLITVAGVLALLGSLLLSWFLAYVRPLRRLLSRAREVASGGLRRIRPSGLSGASHEIERVMDDLAGAVDSHKIDRQNFVTAVATDLRVPLLPLQASATLLASDRASELSPEQRGETAEVVKLSATRLTRALEDLTDILHLEQGPIQLDERIVDLRDLISRVALLMGGSGSTHDVRADVPQLPVWAFVDSARIERVLINLISKMMQYSPQGGMLEISLLRQKRGDKRGGAEILIHEGVHSEGHAARSSGPEMDLLKHWVSENGFGLTLAQKIAESHGGTITASGVAGTSVSMNLKLPEDRITGVAKRSRLPGKVYGASTNLSQAPGLTPGYRSENRNDSRDDRGFENPLKNPL